MSAITGLRVRGDRICNKGETKSSTNVLGFICLEISGVTLECQDLKISIFSNDSARHLQAQKAPVFLKNKIVSCILIIIW